MFHPHKFSLIQISRVHTSTTSQGLSSVYRQRWMHSLSVANALTKAVEVLASVLAISRHETPTDYVGVIFIKNKGVVISHSLCIIFESFQTHQT